MKSALIVDDESLILEGLTKYLANIHFNRIATAKNGKDALNEIAAFRYRLCFLDIYLPDINGLDVMEKIKEISPETRVVIMTSHDITDSMKKRIDEQAFHFISKPFDLSQIKTITELAMNDVSAAGKDEKDFSGRLHRRRPYAQSMDYSAGVYESGELKVLNLKASVIDISDGGIGLLTDYELKPGYIIRFEKGTKQNIGIVKWSISTGDHSFRAGIEFLKNI